MCGRPTYADAFVLSTHTQTLGRLGKNASKSDVFWRRFEHSRELAEQFPGSAERFGAVWSGLAGFGCVVFWARCRARRAVEIA